MFTAFSLAVADTFAPEQRRPLFLSLGLALALLVALWIGASVLIDGIRVSGLAWLDWAAHVFGSLAALAVAWILYPAMSMLILGFFLDGVIAALERAHYPALPPVRRIGLTEAAVSGLRLAGLAIVINLVILPLYFAPAVGQVAYYGLNGWLVGREYFDQVALRRLERREALALWRAQHGAVIAAGVVIALLLSVPFVNLVAPLTGAAFMLHRFEALRRG